MTLAPCLCRKPEAPDWMGSMNPFWQTLDQIFGAHFNATTNETDSYYTTFYHPVTPQHRCPFTCLKGMDSEMTHVLANPFSMMLG